MTRTKALRLGLMGVSLLAGCTRPAATSNPAELEQRYGLQGAYADSVATSAGVLHGTVVPITMAGGQTAELFIPTYQSRDVDAVYLRDEQGLHPVRLTTSASRDDMVRSPALVTTRPAQQAAKTRSWERELFVVGAAVGATADGVGGLIYDLITRRKD